MLKTALKTIKARTKVTTKALVMFSLLASLTACTGSFEVLPERFLLFGYGNQIALLNTDALASDVAPEDRELQAVTNLPANSIARDYDFTRRDGLRDELLVLSREGNLGYVSRFDVSDLSLQNPSLSSNGSLQVDLDNLEVATGVSIEPEDLCPDELQVSENGRYLVLLNDQSDCGSSARSDSITVIDTQGTDSIVAQLSLNFAFDDYSGIYLAQDSGRLFYTQLGTSSTELYRFDLSSLSAQRLLRLDEQLEVRDLELIDNVLALLSDGDVLLISAPLSKPAEGLTLATISNPLQLVATEQERLYVRSSSRFGVHSDFEDNDPDERSVSSVDAVLEPAGNFVYFLSSELIYRFDALLYEPDDSLSFASYQLPGLSNPVFISWLQAFVEDMPSGRR